MSYRLMLRLITLSLCLTCLTGSLLLTRAQEPDAHERIRVDTTLVSVPVIVSDRQGRYVADLRQEDFTLYQDRVRQNIAFFAATEAPLNVALLLDTSKSTREVLGKIKKAATAFIKQLRPQDRALIVTFDFEVQVLSPLTSDRKRLERAIKKAEIGREVGTTLHDAVSETTARQFRGVDGRKAIILLTDGKDVGSHTSARELLLSVEESDTMIYPIFYETGPIMGRVRQNQRRFPFPLPGGRGRRFPLSTQYPPQFPPRRGGNARFNERAEEFLRELAEASAGRYYRSEVTDLDQTFALIADELRHQYRLGFYPEDNRPDVLHQLRVAVNRADVVVRARHSYRLTRNGLP